MSVSQYGEVADFFTSTSPKTVTGLAWEAGDWIIVMGGIENAQATLDTPTNANLTFSLVASAGITGSGGNSPVYVWAAEAGSSQTGQTIQGTRAVVERFWGFAVWVIPGSGTANATAKTTPASAFSLNVAADSTVVYFEACWNAVSGRTLSTGSGTPTERRDATDGSSWGQMAGDWVGVSSGSFSFGLGDYTGHTDVDAQGVIEVLAVAGEVDIASVSAPAAGLAVPPGLEVVGGRITGRSIHYDFANKRIVIESGR